MAQVFIIGQEEKELMQALKEHAEKHPINAERMLLMFKGEEQPIGEDPDFRIELPVGVRIVYSIETQPGGLARHISVSIAPGKIPNPAIVEEVLKEFGFVEKNLKPTTRWLEGDTAVNYLQLM